MWRTINGENMNPSKRKGDTFERSIVHKCESVGLKAYRNRMSRAEPGSSWDVSIVGKHFECKKRKDSFKKIREWIIGNDGVILGADREDPLIVLKLEDYLGMLT
jgi:hypothetical protein